MTVIKKFIVRSKTTGYYFKFDYEEDYYIASIDEDDLKNGFLPTLIDYNSFKDYDGDNLYTSKKLKNSYLARKLWSHTFDEVEFVDVFITFENSKSVNISIEFGGE
jgi:hypothetical protein